MELIQNYYLKNTQHVTQAYLDNCQETNYMFFNCSALIHCYKNKIVMMLDQFDPTNADNGSPMYNATSFSNAMDPTTVTAWFTLPAHGVAPGPILGWK